eukprot:11614159-Ditylum_brightwellii.AAC.1
MVEQNTKNIASSTRRQIPATCLNIDWTKLQDGNVKWSFQSHIHSKILSPKEDLHNVTPSPEYIDAAILDTEKVFLIGDQKQTQPWIALSVEQLVQL